MKLIHNVAAAALQLMLAVALLAVAISLLGWPRFADYTQITESLIAWRFLFTGLPLALAFLVEIKSKPAAKIMVSLALIVWLIFFFILDDVAIITGKDFSPLNYRMIVPLIILFLNVWFWWLEGKISTGQLHSD